MTAGLDTFYNNTAYIQQMILQPEERVLFIINDNAVHGATRLQKYGFLLHKQYRKELSELAIEYMVPFYDDWKAYHYGPFSRQLEADIEKCVDAGLIKKDAGSGNHKYDIYSLTTKGRVKWRRLLAEKTSEIGDLHEKIRLLQAENLRTLLTKIYNAYPEYIVNSRIRDEIASH